MVPVVVFCGILTQRVLMQERQRKIAQEEAIIQGATQLLEEKFQQLNTLGNQLSFSTWLTKTQSFSPLLNNTIDYFRRKEICQELSVYLAGIGIAEDIMVIFPEKDISPLNMTRELNPTKHRKVFLPFSGSNNLTYPPILPPVSGMFPESLY